VKIIGIGLIALAVIWGISAINMNTSIITESRTVGEGIYSTYVPSQTIHNLSLADHRRNHLIGAGISLLAGILLFGFGSLQPNGGMQGRTCPFCAETIKEEAKICRYCNKDLPELKRASHSQQSGILSWFSNYAKRTR